MLLTIILCKILNALLSHESRIINVLVEFHDWVANIETWNECNDAYHNLDLLLLWLPFHVFEANLREISMYFLSKTKYVEWHWESGSEKEKFLENWENMGDMTNLEKKIFISIFFNWCIKRQLSIIRFCNTASCNYERSTEHQFI